MLVNHPASSRVAVYKYDCLQAVLTHLFCFHASPIPPTPSTVLPQRVLYSAEGSWPAGEFTALSLLPEGKTQS